jgi:hypothetical protein
MCFHAVHPGGGAPRWQPLIAPLAATTWKCQSSVLAGNSGDGGRQLRQGGGGGARLLAAGLLTGVAPW